MAKVLDAIDDDLTEFLHAQRVFFVASAPSEGAHVNVSPKGYDSFRVIGPHTVAYLDLTGSGVETIAHVRENGRITIMFCAFAGAPRIIRLYGQGEVLVPGHADFADLLARFPPMRGTRSIIRVQVDRVQSSCGYAVPFMSFEEERDTLRRWSEHKSDDDLVRYHAEKSARSIDGLPGLPVGDE